MGLVRFTKIRLRLPNKTLKVILASLAEVGSFSMDHRQNVILITIDCLRADYVGCLGHTHQATPKHARPRGEQK